MSNINRSSIDEAITNLEGIFNGTKEVLEEYQSEKKALEEREAFIKDQLSSLQEEHSQIMIDREGAKDKPNDYVQLTQQLTSIEEKVKVLLSLQEQLKEEYTELKERYLISIRDAYSKDKSAVRKTFNVNELVHSIRDELKQAIADYEQAIDKQDQQVMPLIQKDFLSDSDLMNESWDNPSKRRKVLSFRRIFEFDRNRLFYDKEIKL